MASLTKSASGHTFFLPVILLFYQLHSAALSRRIVRSTSGQSQAGNAVCSVGAKAGMHPLRAGMVLPSHASVSPKTTPRIELCARSGLVPRLKAKQLVGVKPMPWRCGSPGNWTGWAACGRSVARVCWHGVPYPMYVCKAILCDTSFHSNPAVMSRWRDALPPVAPITALPAQSPFRPCGTCHKHSGCL
jgi:hypothetical protein